MNRLLPRACATLAFLVLAASAQAELPAPVSDTLARTKIPADGVAALVLRLSDGAVMVSHNADKPMQPASTMKLVTTAAGLNLLGPTYKARTAILTAGTMKNDILFGDIILRGGGDTELTTAALQDMLQTLRHKGIRHIRGDIVVDRSLYQPARLDVGVPPFDEAPEFRYNVIPDALLLNLNLHKLELSADDETLRVSAWPAMDRVRFVNRLTLVDGSCGNWDAGWKIPTVEKTLRGEIRVTLHGTFPKHCSKVTEINVIDRTDYAERLVRALWKSLGGSISGGAREDVAPDNARILAEHVSRPLMDVLRDINKPSDNTFARILLLDLGAISVPDVIAAKATTLAPDMALTTLARGERELRAWMTAQGVDTTGLVVENGSGLSRTERISPTTMAGLLLAAHKSMWAPEFKSSLPLAGMDGTMRSRLKTSPAAGRARVKTGTLRNVTANAGYITDTLGREYIIAAMVNSDSMKSAEGRAVLDSLIDWVARQDATPAVVAEK